MSGANLSAVPVAQVAVRDGFWADRQQVYREVTLPHCLAELESTGRLANFRRAAGQEPGGFQGRYGFDDSDVYKVLEGIAYVLMTGPSPALAARADEMFRLIAAAQEPDGYLFTRSTLSPERTRWSDMNSHEMYTGGHFIEAAVAYHQATGSAVALDTARRLADHYRTEFGPGRRHWVDGHEEVGLALMRLADETGDEGYADFALWHLEERGRGHGRGAVWDDPAFGAAYSQDRIPVADLRAAEGHAVRLMYLMSGMTDAAVRGHEAYAPALRALWDNVVQHHLYVTGGIGAAGGIEGFGAPDALPNREAYCETCAAIALVLWADRMNRWTGDASAADVIEQVLYNGLLAGWSQSGDRFFYDNPLESDGSHRRQPWFGCACCPSNLARFLPSVGRYVYAIGGDTVYVNQFISSDARLAVGGQPVHVAQRTGFPWAGRVTLQLAGDNLAHVQLAIRKPAWAASATVTVNGAPVPVRWARGYLVCERVWQTGDEVAVEFPLPVRRVHASPAVVANRGSVALARGPLVYAVEGADNPGGVEHAACPPSALLLADPLAEVAGLGPTVRVRAIGPNAEAALTAIPYFLWANRDPGPMRVWLPEL